MQTRLTPDARPLTKVPAYVTLKTISGASVFLRVNIEPTDGRSLEDTDFAVIQKLGLMGHLPRSRIGVLGVALPGIHPDPADPMG